MVSSGKLYSTELGLRKNWDEKIVLKSEGESEGIAISHVVRLSKAEDVWEIDAKWILIDNYNN